MIIKSVYEPIHRLIKFIHYNSAYVDVWFDGFGYSNNFEDTLVDLLANYNKIENVDYSKFIVYIMLSKFCPNIHTLTLPPMAFPNILKTNYLKNLTKSLMFYKKRIVVDVENNLIASIFLNLIVEQEYKYISQVVFVNSFVYYLCLLF